MVTSMLVGSNIHKMLPTFTNRHQHPLFTNITVTQANIIKRTFKCWYVEKSMNWLRTVRGELKSLYK